MPEVGTGSRVLCHLSESSKKSPEPLLEGPAKSEHMLALLPFKFPASGKYNAIFDLFVTATTTIHVRAAKELFDIILHEVYFLKVQWHSMKVSFRNFCFIVLCRNVFFSVKF